MFEKLCDILEEFSGVSKDEMTLDSDILIDLSMNSIDVMEMVVVVEDTFSVSVPDRDIIKFRTIGDVVSYLEEII